jgi:hypothetical protein
VLALSVCFASKLGALTRPFTRALSMANLCRPQFASDSDEMSAPAFRRPAVGGQVSRARVVRVKASNVLIVNTKGGGHAFIG